jgi:hypothetical protein
MDTIKGWLAEDPRFSAREIFECLADEYGFEGSYSKGQCLSAEIKRSPITRPSVAPAADTTAIAWQRGRPCRPVPGRL